MAPFTPFLTEHIYQNLRRCHGADPSDKSESVHFCDVPSATQESQADTHIQQVTADCSEWSICC
jgi:isoleucyl-tRNA synthetase